MYNFFRDLILAILITIYVIYVAMLFYTVM
jgi:hypothetical protein